VKPDADRAIDKYPTDNRFTFAGSNDIISAWIKLRRSFVAKLKCGLPFQKFAHVKSPK
jgi:hypothetical protein